MLFTGNFTLESCEKGDCDCTVYVFYCQQDSNDHPYQEKAAELCSTLSVLPGGPRGCLAVLRTPRIDSAVRNYIITNDLDGKPCIFRFGFWIGLSDGLIEGEYVWCDGGALAPTKPSATGHQANQTTTQGKIQMDKIAYNFGSGALAMVFGTMNTATTDQRVLSVKFQIPIVIPCHRNSMIVCDIKHRTHNDAICGSFENVPFFVVSL
ncbi:uncharacterized protein [Ptychodera flava]|uniref:uncharacterized protein isoform X1 n=1 Tax=Ptychodera flava TaxID=63121 RepID=UPI003969F0CC